MSDANWTPAATEQAIALWVGGKDVAEIAVEFGVAPGEVLSRIAQAAIAGKDGRAQAGQARVAASAKAASATTDVPNAPPCKTLRSKATSAKAPGTKMPTIKDPRAKNSSEAPATVQPVTPTRTAFNRPAVEPAPTAMAQDAARAPVPQSKRPVADAVRPAPRPAPLRLVSTPPMLLAEEAPDPEASAAALPAVRGYEAVALPAPVRTSKRLLVAADGGAGMPFMKATTLDCHFPLWADTETVSIERKRVCGCRALAGKSWCAHHLRAVFEPPRKPQPRVA